MIKKGEAWGSSIMLSGDEPVIDDDAALADYFDQDRFDQHGFDQYGADSDLPVAILRGGDLYTSLGGARSPEPIGLPVDLLVVTIDGERFVAVAHVVAHRWLWAGQFAVAMNGTHLGGWNLGPKAHPNDGLVDSTTGSLSVSDRLAARRRAPTASHLPHPALTTKRGAAVHWRFERPTPIRVDGVARGRTTAIDIVVAPDRGVVVLA